MGFYLNKRLLNSKRSIKMIFFSLFVYFLSTLAAVEARDTCQFVNGTIYYCLDYGSSYGYCCNPDGDGYYQNCCYYNNALYALWYFWVGLIAGLIVLVAICAVVIRYCVRREVNKITSKTTSPPAPHQQNVNNSTQQAS